MFSVKQDVTIRLEADTLDAVRQYAQVQGKSISSVVEEALTHSVLLGPWKQNTNNSVQPASAEMRSWRGAFQLIEQPHDYHQILMEELTKKYQ
jgi:hypothetical protein